MNGVLRYAVVAVIVATTILPASAKRRTSHAHARPANKVDTEAAARLQIFLDRANFSPGKIDGRYNDLTLEALALYRQSRGEQVQLPPKQSSRNPNAAPDVTGLDLTSVDPVFIPYVVTETDLQAVGQLPSKVVEQAKLKFMPYRDVGDAIAEKFHSDIHLLEHLNQGKLKTAKPGDQLMVPNVEPFELASVKDIKPGSEIASQAANEMEDQPDAQTGNPDISTNGAGVSLKVNTKANALEVQEGDKLIAAYPVTVGSAHTASPIGEWKVRRI